MVIAVSLVAIACSGSKGDPGMTGNTALLRTSSVAPGAECANGGSRVDTGLDRDANGRLADGEVDSTLFVCDGADGHSPVVTLVPPGVNCAAGGLMVTPAAGAPSYVCNGDGGADGVDGASVTMTPELPGPYCQYGGQKLQVGAGTPSYVCNGAPGSAGADGQSVAMTPVAAGPQCQYGGQKLQVGAGTARYVCDGAPGATGATGADGQSVAMTPEPPGANCEFGGVRLQVGTGPEAYLCSGALAGAVRPSVETVGVTGTRYTESVVDARVTENGSELVLARGVAVSTHAGPTVEDAVWFSGAGAGSFAIRCDGLAPGTTYHVRAFATNVLGTRYGNELTFTTRALTVPTLGTQPVSNVTNATALSGGDVADDGGTPIIARGICWSAAPDPALDAACAAEPGDAESFVAMLTGLAADTTYHVRAYATNTQGTGYGEDRSFTTVALQLASVTTAAPSGVSFSGVVSGGNVASDNGSPVTSRGVCWATTPAPTTAGAAYSEAGGLGIFTVSVAGLSPGTTYYLRAFAVSGAGTSYGNQVSFTTPATSTPSLTTKPAVGISSYLAGSGGVIASDGGSPITAKGICWSLNPNPTVANSKTTDGTGSASFNSTLTGLAPLTTYHVRAYATNGVGTAYGNDVSFTTTDLVTPGPSVPVVGTTTTSISGSSTASSGGYVSSDGGSAVTVRGVCWSTHENPTSSDTCSVDGESGEGFFSSTLTGLSGCGVVYYVRAYATNSTGTGYGNQNTVSTGLLAKVTTAPVSEIGYYGAKSGGMIVDDGGCAISQRGVVWSWSPNPTTSNAKTTNGTGSAPFASSITGLYGNRTYYVRAYATNTVGTTYGQQEVFTTAEPPTPYLGQAYAGGIVFHIDDTKQHGLVVAPSNQGSFRWGCTGTTIPTDGALGSGATNTAAIVASCGEAGTAATAADNLVLNGYDDWFLPSQGELGLLRANLQGEGIGGLGGLVWSSTQADAASALVLDVDYGYFMSWWKERAMTVRAIRAF